MKIFKPMLITDLKNYSGSQLTKDIIAGIIVAIIALLQLRLTRSKEEEA